MHFQSHQLYIQEALLQYCLIVPTVVNRQLCWLHFQRDILTVILAMSLGHHQLHAKPDLLECDVTVSVHPYAQSGIVSMCTYTEL